MKTSTTVTIISAMRAATASHSCTRCTLPANLKTPSRMLICCVPDVLPPPPRGLPGSARPDLQPRLFCVGREEFLGRFSLAFEISDRLVDNGLRQLLHLCDIGGRQGED